MTALLLSTSILGASDVVFRDTFDLSLDGCPDSSIRATISDIRYPTSGMSLRYDVDITKFENIWGHLNNSDSAVLWPGRNSSGPALRNFGKNQFIAARFHVPPGIATTSSGFYGYATYFSGPSVELAISSACGDFLPANPACVSTHGAGESFGKWRIQPSALNCPLAPDTDYFVNVRLVDALPEDCGYQPECYIGLNSIFTN
jgi:hypothetical protein